VRRLASFRLGECSRLGLWIGLFGQIGLKASCAAVALWSCLSQRSVTTGAALPLFREPLGKALPGGFCMYFPHSLPGHLDRLAGLPRGERAALRFTRAITSMALPRTWPVVAYRFRHRTALLRAPEPARSGARTGSGRTEQVVRSDLGGAPADRCLGGPQSRYSNYPTLVSRVRLSLLACRGPDTVLTSGRTHLGNGHGAGFYAD